MKITMPRRIMLAVAIVSLLSVLAAIGTVHAAGDSQAEPTYSCDAFKVTADDANHKVKVTTFTTSATGATFLNAKIDWDDNSPVLTTKDVVGQEHQYDKDKDATYTITAVASFTVDAGEGSTTPGTRMVTVGGQKCRQEITFKRDKPSTPTTPAPTTPTPKHTPPTTTPPAVTTSPTPPKTPAAPTAATPTQLNNTGPGSVVGWFGAATILGALARRRMLASRLSADS